MVRIAGGALVLAVLAWLCALALPRGLADLRAFEARMLVKSWASRQPAQEELNLAHALLREARALDPGQPNYLEDIARLREPREALELQRQAARLRPGSPYTWASIALLKARLPEPDLEFQAALRNAALLGPWEPEVQLALADAGYQHWGALAPETRAAMNANALRTLHRQDAKLFDLARRRGRLEVLCAVRGIERSQLARACI